MPSNIDPEKGTYLPDGISYRPAAPKRAWDILGAQSQMSPDEIGNLQTGNTRDLNFNMYSPGVASEGDELSLDPVEVQKAASTVARAKQAMQYLKDALSALKTQGKKAGAAVNEGVSRMVNPIPQRDNRTEQLFGAPPQNQDQEVLDYMDTQTRR